MHKVLVIGGGSIGERHARCLLETGRAEVALCDNRPERLAEMAQKYDLAETFEDYDAVDLDAFDAVVVCVPAHLHVPFARRAVDAGLHVLIEKPLAIAMDGVRELLAGVREKGITCGVAYVRRAMPAAQLAKEAVDSGRFGEFKDVVYHVSYDHRVARPDYRNTYEVKRAMGGGAVQDALSHLVNLVAWLVGPISHVAAAYDHLLVEGMDAEDTASVMLRFRDRPTMATVHVSMWCPGRQDRLVLSGDEAQIVCDGLNGCFGVFRRGAEDWEWQEIDLGKRDEKGQVDGPFLAEAENFLDAVEGEAELLCTLEDGIHTLRVCMAATESGRTGRVVEVPEQE